MEDMTIGMCLDYAGYFFENKNPNSNREETRQAKQEDFDRF